MTGILTTIGLRGTLSCAGEHATRSNERGESNERQRGRDLSPGVASAGGDGSGGARGARAGWRAAAGPAARSRSIPSAGEWKRFAGTQLNFISENTAPTSAIAANLAPFKELTGIDIKISQLELTALVQKVALDLASGQGSYQIIYADPYQVLAPYHGALADLNGFNADPDVPKVQDLADFIPTQLDAAGKFVDKERDLRAALRRPDDGLDVPQGRLRRQPRPDAAGARVRPDAERRAPPGSSTTRRRSGSRKNKPDGIPYGSGHQAKQHDSLMNDFSNVLWAYGGDYFDDGANVGRFGSNDPGEPRLDSRRGDRRRRHVPQAALGRASLLAELGLDGAGRGVPGRPVRDGGRVARVRRRLRDVQDRGQGRLRAAAQGPEAARVHVRRHRDRRSTARRQRTSRRRRGCS